MMLDQTQKPSLKKVNSFLVPDATNEEQIVEKLADKHLFSSASITP